MLDLPGQPILDKQALVGGCIRLPLRADAALLVAEVAALPADLWGTRGGRVGVHNPAEAIFLRGHAPAEGDLPIHDRPALALLPTIRKLIETTLPAPPLRCLLAKLPAGATIAAHVDRAPYFAKSVRLHVPIETNDAVWMIAGEDCYSMAPGEIWALNNSARHAVWNAHATASRTHLICDFLPSTALLGLLARGERKLGRHEPRVLEHIRAAAPVRIARG